MNSRQMSHTFHVFYFPEKKVRKKEFAHKHLLHTTYKLEIYLDS